LQNTPGDANVVIEVSEKERLERALNEASFDMVLTHNLYIYDQRENVDSITL
jgi:hypothetical protein